MCVYVCVCRLKLRCFVSLCGLNSSSVVDCTVCMCGVWAKMCLHMCLMRVCALVCLLD